MDAVGEGPDRCAGREGYPPSSSSPLSSPSHSPTQSWPPAESPLEPPWMNSRQMELGDDSLDHRVGLQSSSPPRFYEELFCSGRQTPSALVPLAGALVTPSGLQGDVVMQGYVGKLELNHRRYFVLRVGSHTGPSRLEWYRSQEKFKAVEQSAGKAVLFGPSKQGTIYLRCCLGVSRIGGSRKGHTVALYATDQTMVLVLEDQLEQEKWYQAIKKLMEEEREDEEHGEGFEEEDDGYCTLPHAGFFKEVWPVMVKPRGLGCSKSLVGESRLCLTVTSLVLVRVPACSDFPSVTIPLLSVRRFGHLDGSFFLELGRSAPHGPGEIWMETRDQGNPAGAQHIHEVVRETVRKLRALPDFSRSPNSNPNQLQTLLASKLCKPKYRGRMMNVRSLGPRLAPIPRTPEIQTSYPEPCKLEPESTLSSTSRLGSRHSSVSDTGSYVEMKVDHQVPVNDCRGATTVTWVHCGVRAWDPGEEEEEGEEGGLEYMMMSPQTSHSSSVLPGDDYMTMASPRKQDWPAYSSPSSSHQTSFNSSTSDTSSPLRPPHRHTMQLARTLWPLISVQPSETEAGQSQISINCSTRPQDDTGQEQNSTEQRQVPDQSHIMVPDESRMMIPFVLGGPDWTKLDKASLNSGPSRSSRVRAAPEPSVRQRLASCLPSCLQAADRS